MWHLYSKVIICFAQIKESFILTWQSVDHLPNETFFDEAFANIKNLPATSSKNIDLNHSLNGPNVNYESTSLIQIKKSDNQIKPKIPAKPSHLKNVQYENKIGYGQPTLLSNSRRIENVIDKAAPNCIPMQLLESSTPNVNEPLEQDDNNELR